jgi:predicted DNA-binding protein
MLDAEGMNKKIKKTKLEKDALDENKPHVPSMSFRFGEETMDKLGMLSVYLGRSMAATVKDMIHAQYSAQFDNNKVAVSEATKKWAAKKAKRSRGRPKKKEPIEAP